MARLMKTENPVMATTSSKEAAMTMVEGMPVFFLFFVFLVCGGGGGGGGVGGRRAVGGSPDGSAGRTNS
jgi:hypothetical protein